MALGVLRNRNYRMWLIGLSVAHIGTWMQRIAQDWLILELTGQSGTALGVVTGLQFLPLLLVGPIGGVIADRFDKRWTLLWTQAAVGACALALGALVFSGAVGVGHIYLVSALLGVANAVFHPTVQAFVLELVDREDVPRVVALSGGSFQAARLVGPGVAGLLILVGGTGPVFLVAAATVVFPIVALARMDTRRLAPVAAQGTGPRMFADGVRFAATDPRTRLLLGVVAFVGMFAANTQVTTALMAVAHFGEGAAAYGLLGSLMAVGSIVGAAIVVTRRDAIGPRFVITAGLVFCLANIVSAAMPSYPTFACALVGVGVAQLVFTTAANSALQLSAAPAMRGRVMALFTMLMMGSTPIGAPILGWVADAFGARTALIAGSGTALVGVAVVVAVCLPSVNRAAVRTAAEMEKNP